MMRETDEPPAFRLETGECDLIPHWMQGANYSVDQLLSGDQGSVKVSFLVTPEGNVVDVEVAGDSSSVFIAAALEAVRQWKFKPNTCDNVRVTKEFVFALAES